MLGHGRNGQIIWDFPGPFLRFAPAELPRSSREPPLHYWESGYGWNGRSSAPSALMRAYLDRPREQLTEPFDNPWELAVILRTADRRLGKDYLLTWARRPGPRTPRAESHSRAFR
jgi:hypothetical protein